VRCGAFLTPPLGISVELLTVLPLSLSLPVTFLLVALPHLCGRGCRGVPFCAALLWFLHHHGCITIVASLLLLPLLGAPPAMHGCVDGRWMLECGRGQWALQPSWFPSDTSVEEGAPTHLVAHLWASLIRCAGPDPDPLLRVPPSLLAHLPRLLRAGAASLHRQALVPVELLAGGSWEDPAVEAARGRIRADCDAAVGTHVAGVLVTLFACARAALEHVDVGEAVEGDAFLSASVELSRTSASFMHAAGVAPLDTALVVAAACLDYAWDARPVSTLAEVAMSDNPPVSEAQVRLGVRLAVARLTEAVVPPRLGRAEHSTESNLLASGLGPRQPLAILHMLLRWVCVGATSTCVFVHVMSVSPCSRVARVLGFSPCSPWSQ
jgi:hypothetical protein